MKTKEKKPKARFRNLSIFKYVISFVIVIIAVVCFVTVATIEIIVRRAIPDEVRRELSTENRQVLKTVKCVDGEIVVEDYKTDYEGYDFAIVDEEGRRCQRRIIMC